MKTQLKILVGIISPVILLIVLIGWVVVRDSRPPKDEGLGIRALQVPEHQNGYRYFQTAARQLYWGDGAARVGEILGDWSNYDHGFVQDMLYRNAGVIDYVCNGLTCEYNQAPGLPGVEAEVPLAGQWGGAVRVLALQTLHHWRRNEHKESMESAMTIVRFGNRLEDSRSRIGYWQLGASFKEYGAGHIRRLLVVLNRLGPEDLKSYAAELQDCAVNEKGLSDTLKSEYAALCGAMDALAAGAARSDKGARYPENIKVGFQGFLPNKTKVLLAKGFERLAGEANTVAARLKGASEIGEVRRLEQDGPMATLYGNPQGVMIYLQIAKRMDGVLSARCHEEASLSATSVLLALKAYKMARGKLPDSLGQLVPEFLKAVPRDAYDGLPLRYSVKKKVVYSVGEDLYDSTAAEETEAAAPPAPPSTSSGPSGTPAQDSEVRTVMPAAPAQDTGVMPTGSPNGPPATPPALSDDMVFPIQF